MSKYTLCICYPTYNRGELLFLKINQYLTLHDNRFCITVQDNCSTDGSFEKLKAIDDERFRLRQNEHNIGFIPNSQRALLGNMDADYILFSIDKDILDINYLPQFIDYLKESQPYYGYVDLYTGLLKGEHSYRKGIEALQGTAYLSKHPTGFFWRRELFEQEVSQTYFAKLPDKFDFWFDVVTAHFAVRYPASVVYIPFILHGKRIKDASVQKLLKHNKSISYNTSNLYFNTSKRLETSDIYIQDLLSLDISTEEKKTMAFICLKRLMFNVSLNLRGIFHNNWEAYHYHFEWRTIPWTTLIGNLYKAQKLYNRKLKGHDALRHVKSMIAIVYFAMKTTLKCMIELIKKPKNIPYIP